jgi:hypothetical protein
MLERQIGAQARAFDDVYDNDDLHHSDETPDNNRARAIFGSVQ